MSKVKIEIKGDRAVSAGMTLAEMEQFVKRARRLGASGAEAPRVTATFRGTVKELRLTIDHEKAADGE